ncbi:two-component system response regulator [Alkalilimnicola ehrlichii]|uniref:response regulator n=1 Tax=Alkalilimnicola ehrlichii TaxID=351052 RepID=UPI000E2FA844|nr:response regulator [Alkalilimnicola ehrlichii]RFA30036.1 two-component system response regulator [Alkalilimnicola ehrlichii]
MARILVVDDSPVQALTLRRMLEKHGHEVLVAENGRLGIEAARQEKPDLILMDVVMPELNGFQATREINRDPGLSAIPVVIVSTKDEPIDKVYGERQGASGYLIKPPTEADLLRTINTLLTSA